MFKLTLGKIYTPFETYTYDFVSLHSQMYFSVQILTAFFGIVFVHILTYYNFQGVSDGS